MFRLSTIGLSRARDVLFLKAIRGVRRHVDRRQLFRAWTGVVRIVLPLPSFDRYKIRPGSGIATAPPSLSDAAGRACPRGGAAEAVGAYCYIHFSLKQAAEFSDGLPELSDEIDGAENPGKILSQTSDLCDIQKAGSGRFK